MSITQYWLDLRLVTEGPLHSGGTEEQVDRTRADEEREATLRRLVTDASGAACLPGRSVKGALRSALRRAGSEAGNSPLWGSIEVGPSVTVHPIRLPQVPEEQTVERFGIAVDRRWGSVGDGALFTREVVPAGTPLTLQLSARVGWVEPLSGRGDTSEVCSASEEDVRRLFAEIVAVVRSGGLTLGARRSAGWGRVRLADADAVTARRADLSSPEGLRSYRTRGQEIELPQVEDLASDSRVSVEIMWSSPTGILVAAPDPKEDEEGRKRTVPMRAGAEGSPYVLPGSSVRGALRSRCSRIARTVLAARGEQLRDWTDVGVHDQLADDVALVRALFGDTGRRGAVTVMDTHARGGVTQVRSHNAGDRWTGGVKDGALFTEEHVVSDWEPIRLDVDLKLLGLGEGGETPTEAEERERVRAGLCLLGLALAELSTGCLPLGSRGTRGLGEARAHMMTVRGPEDLLGAREWRIGSDGADGESVAMGLLEHLRRVNEALESGWAGYLTQTGAQQ